MTSDSSKQPSNKAGEHDGDDNLAVDNDGRDFFSPQSRWPEAVRKQQRNEAIYIVVLLLISLLVLSGLGLINVYQSSSECTKLFGLDWPNIAFKYGLLGAGGLLGGTVYGAKWLYHAVAKGLWHEDRRLWRFMQPWISLGTTVGIWSLIDSGFFKTAAPQDVSMLGIGFVVGYLSDQFLAKMKEVTNVLFGSTERHFEKVDKDNDSRP